MADHDAGERSSANSFGKDPLSTTTSMLPIEGPNSQTSPRPEVRRVSGNFNAPTYVEVERHKDTNSPRGFRGRIRSLVKRSPPTVA
jgi:hypothetical protein